MKRVIKSRDEIKDLVDLFYSAVRKDQSIGPIFNQVIGHNWSTHLERMYQFWETLLFASGGFKGSPYQVHEKLPLTENHFNRWLQLFEKTLADNFEGDKADEALSKAENIALIFQYKLGLKQ